MLIFQSMAPIKNPVVRCLNTTLNNLTWIKSVIIKLLTLWRKSGSAQLTQISLVKTTSRPLKYNACVIESSLLIVKQNGYFINAMFQGKIRVLPINKLALVYSLFAHTLMLNNHDTLQMKVHFSAIQWQQKRRQQ